MADTDDPVLEPKRSRARKPVALPDTPDPIEIAMREANHGALADSLPGRLLESQVTLIRAQLTELKLKRLLWSIVIGVALLALTGLALAAWNASRSRSLVVEPFRVPPSLAARGLDGTVLASRVLDELARLRDDTDSVRAVDSYANGWEGDIRIAIPNVGISVGEAWRYLRAWLGHDSRIGGEAFETPDGIAITVRTSSAPGETFSGDERQLDPLLREAAIAVFRQTQPYRYAVFVARTRGEAAAVPLMRAIAEGDGPISERRWGYTGWAAQNYLLGDYHQSLQRALQATELDPGFGKAWINVGAALGALGRSEELLHSSNMAIRLIEGSSDHSLSPRGYAHHLVSARTERAQLLGDWTAVAALHREQATLPEYSGNSLGARISLVAALARLGDHRAAWRAWRGLPSNLAGMDRAYLLDMLGDRAAVLGAWGDAAQLYERSLRALAVARDAARAPGVDFGTLPKLAAALARARRIDEARRLIAPTAPDCYPCLLARGEIAAAARDWRRAGAFFAEADRQGPSLPAARLAWGRMLAAAGNDAGAIEHFRVANERGPGSFEPLAAWGDALMRRRAAREAVDKYRQASALAPRHAAIRLAHGRALWLSGRRAEARQVWDEARRLDLTPADRAQLARIEALTGGA